MCVRVCITENLIHKKNDERVLLAYDVNQPYSMVAGNMYGWEYFGFIQYETRSTYTIIIIIISRRTKK